jgi:Uma2 family endonuclease
MTMFTFDISPLVQLTDEAFAELCRANPDMKFERTVKGELIVVSPTGGESGVRNSRLTTRVGVWTEADNTGVAFDSSTCFNLPNGALRSPDAAWIRLERWETLTPKQRQGYPPISPDFVIELRSPTDDLSELQSKMQEYCENGVRLGWLLDPQNQRVEIYRPGQAVEVLQSPLSLSGEDVLPGFTLNLDRIL